GDLLTQRWTGERIEILFSDVCKSLGLNSYVVKTFFPCLIPNHSVVIHQDFYHPWHPYIHYSMQFLKPHFEIIDELVGQRRVFLLRERIPTGDLKRVAADAFTPEEKVCLLRELRSQSQSPMREMAEVACLHQLQRDRNWEEFDAMWVALTERADFEAVVQRQSPAQPWASAALRMYKNSQRQRGISPILR